MKKPTLTTMLLLTLTSLVLASVIIRTIYETRTKPDINVVADSLSRRPEITMMPEMAKSYNSVLKHADSLGWDVLDTASWIKEHSQIPVINK